MPTDQINMHHYAAMICVLVIFTHTHTHTHTHARACVRTHTQWKCIPQFQKSSMVCFFILFVLLLFFYISNITFQTSKVIFHICSSTKTIQFRTPCTGLHYFKWTQASLTYMFQNDARISNAMMQGFPMPCASWACMLMLIMVTASTVM